MAKSATIDAPTIPETNGIPMESRPIRLSPEVERLIRSRIQPLSGAEREAAKAAVLRVYQSGQQMPSDQWVRAYDTEITAAVNAARERSAA